MLVDLKKPPKESFVLLVDVAVIHRGLGEKHQALIWLERAYEQRPVPLAPIKANPGLDPLRSEPRFRELLRRVGLPP